MSNQKAITQEKILRASMEFFSTRGYDKTSITRIATRAGVSRASIFWHFSDKATLFGETCRFFLVPFRESLEQSARGEDPYKRVIAQIASYEDFVHRHRSTIHSFVMWLFASQSQAGSLLAEVLALHRDFVQSLEEDVCQLVASKDESTRIVRMIVSMLHGNMLLSLVDAPQDASINRGELVRDLLTRLIPES